jgi:hypothetical protein
MKRFKEGLQKAVEKGPDPEIAKEAGIDIEKPAEPAKPDEPTKTPEPAKPDEPEAKPAEPEKTPEAEPTKPDSEPPAEPGDDKDKPLGPWQQKQKWEKQAREYESENIKLREQLSQAGDIPELTKRAEAAEERANAFEEKIRMLDFTQSEKYEKEILGPYRDAYQGAVQEMTQLSVTLEDGEKRQITEGDVQYLLNLPKQHARDKAKEVFGERAARENHDRSVEHEKKTGAERYKQEMEQQVAVRQENAKSFQEFKAADDSEQEFLRGKEGDDEWNSLLADRREYVDKSLADSSSNAKLTPEQRREAVRRHATVRGRAIGFSMMKLENTRLKAQVDQLNAKLAEFKTAEPGSGDPPSPPAVASPTDPFARVRAEMQKRSRTRNF